jgi:exo-1,4-beta-D-glucosaminidase
LDDPASTWYYTPQKAYADFTALQSLPRPEVKLDSRFAVHGNDQVANVTLKNSSSNLAFFLRLKLKKGAAGEEVTPVFWEDNYVSLLPGETRQLKAVCRSKDLEGRKPIVEVEMWQ